MTTTSANISTAIVSVPRSKSTSYLKSKLIATLVILCGAVSIISSSPSLQTHARSLLLSSFGRTPVVPEPTFQERLQSKWSSLFTPLTTIANLQETFQMPPIGIFYPEPPSPPEPTTMTDKIVAYYEMTFKRTGNEKNIRPKRFLAYYYFGKNDQQVTSSCPSSSYTACAIHVKDSVVQAMATAGDMIRNIYHMGNDDNNGHDEEEEEKQQDESTTKTMEWTNWLLQLVSYLAFSYEMFFAIKKAFDVVFKAKTRTDEQEQELAKAKRERAAMVDSHNLLWWTAMACYGVLSIVVLAWLANYWYGHEWGYLLKLLGCSIYKVSGKFWHQYNSEYSKYRWVLRVEKVIEESFCWKALNHEMHLRQNQIRWAYYERHGVHATKDVYYKLCSKWYHSYLREQGGIEMVKSRAVFFFGNVDEIKTDGNKMFHMFLTKKIMELRPTHPETE